jgi:hypothetical protein
MMQRFVFFWHIGVTKKGFSRIAHLVYFSLEKQAVEAIPNAKERLRSGGPFNRIGYY